MDMKLFRDKTIVITGAASGIGKALAHEFAKKGANLALCDMATGSLQQTVEELSKYTIKVFSKTVDVSSNQAVLAFADEVQQNIGPADVVINNAGVGHGKMSVEDTPFLDMEWIMGINFWGMVYGSKAFLPQLKKETPTALVNVSSIAGLIPVGNQASYSASKFAIRAVTEGLMMELKNTSIQVHSVHPGGIKTNIVRTARGGDSAYTAVLEKVQVQTPEYAAKKIIRGIEKNTCRIIVGTDAKFAFFAARLLPLSVFNYFQVLYLKQVEKKLKR
jgi:short-subunit dehydrogenase